MIKYARNPLVAWSELFGEVTAITPEDSVLHQLNETASFVWDRLTGENSVEDLSRMVNAEFDVTQEQATADVEAFIARLLERKLLVSHDKAETKDAHP